MGLPKGEVNSAARVKGTPGPMSAYEGPQLRNSTKPKDFTGLQQTVSENAIKSRIHPRLHMANPKPKDTTPLKDKLKSIIKKSLGIKSKPVPKEGKTLREKQMEIGEKARWIRRQGPTG